MGSRESLKRARRRREEQAGKPRGIAPQDWDEAVQPFAEDIERRYEESHQPFYGSFWMCGCPTVLVAEGPRELRATCDKCGKTFVALAVASDQPRADLEEQPPPGA